MTKDIQSAPFAQSFASETGPVALVEQTAGRELRPASVCAWCTPRAEMERLNRLFTMLSHGMCPSCELLFQAGGKP